MKNQEKVEYDPFDETPTLFQFRFKNDFEWGYWQMGVLPKIDIFYHAKSVCLAFGWLFWFVEFWFNAPKCLAK